MKTCILTITTCFGLSFLQADDWPRFQGPAGNGTSTATGLNLSWGDDGPPILWKRTFNEGFGGSAIVGQEVFLIDREPSASDVLYCLSLEDGSEKWTYSYDHAGRLSFPGSRGVPLVTDEAVYFVGGFGQIHRVNQETHKADWVVSIMDEYGAEPPKWGWVQSPILSGDTIIVPAMSKQVGLVGLNKDSGEEIWRTKAVGNSHSNPVLLTLHGVEQAVFVSNLRTISVAVDSGEVLWETDLYPNPIPIAFPTKVSEDLVFLTGGYTKGSCMIRVSDSWEVSKVFSIEQGSQVHPPFVIGEHLYFLANENANSKGQQRVNGGLMCLDFEGNIVWQTGDDPYMGRGNMIYVDGKLLIQDGEIGYLRVVDPSPEGFEQLAVADIFGTKEEVDRTIARQKGKAQIRIPDLKYWSPMALSNGHLLMRGQENVICVSLK